ncbi:hypothetical protein GRS48_14020 [Halorubrum sp. JWXQ-INN 858]|uniref:hypothetical protein n=1 Tax=Halorubrum sp. JWXQ-INN 858 TaxID=2690782 RepID=UPI0013574A76|nr:hypothetical protein [Halorubrum sp. JWXQ-INN 858]MWV65927.1 hypothetical protein [Halorubrum sp. JWXQ-INN 858]
MAADEYYDAIGQVLSYVLSAEDFIHSQREIEEGVHFWILRDGTTLNFHVHPNDRYFVLTYQFLLTQAVSQAYEENNKLLTEHMEQYNVDETRISDEDLYRTVALHRIQDVGEEEAQKIETDIRALATHTDCRIGTKAEQHPEESETEIWNGVTVSGLLYPYESNFGPRDYEQTAQEVLSVGNQIDESIKKLGVMKEIGFEP